MFATTLRMFVLRVEESRAMRLYRLVAAAQGGQAFANLGRRLNIGEEEAARAVLHLLPILTEGLRREIDKPDGLLALLDLLAEGRYQTLCDNPALFRDRTAQERGWRTLQAMIGAEGARTLDDETLARIEAESGVDRGVLALMAPHLAVLAMGVFAQQAEQSLRDALSRCAGNPAYGPALRNPFAVAADSVRAGSLPTAPGGVGDLISSLFRGTNGGAAA